MMRLLALLAFVAAASGTEPARVIIRTDQLRQEFQGLGCGVIFYESHVTSLAERGKDARQAELYDDMFAKVPTRFLQLMIRADHEPKNDNADPWTPAFDPANFQSIARDVAIAKAAKTRRPDIQLFATLYTPPPWMKTNNAETAGGEAKATLRPGMELELAEYIWVFLAQMARQGVPVQYLAIANEPDWPHEQPGYFLTAEQNATLFKVVADYLDRMALKFPDVAKPKLVGPNTLSAPIAAQRYVPALLRTAGAQLAVIASHDYDMRGDRWGDLQKLSGGRPVWVSEWCSRGEDDSPGQINAATEYGLAMHDAFASGANVFMAYDWVYPPRKGGEALIHVDWGNDYTLKKPYWLFRQWAEPLTLGMRVVETSVAGSGEGSLKATSFLSEDGHRLILHIVNLQDAESPILLTAPEGFGTSQRVNRSRTSATEDDSTLPALPRASGGFADTLPPRSMTTYRFGKP